MILEDGLNDSDKELDFLFSLELELVFAFNKKIYRNDIDFPFSFIPSATCLHCCGILSLSFSVSSRHTFVATFYIRFMFLISDLLT